MYFSLIIAFLLLLGVVILGMQNSMPLELKFLFWQLKISTSSVIFNSSMMGGIIVAVLTVPKMVAKLLQVKRLSKKNSELKKMILGFEKQLEEKKE